MVIGHSKKLAIIILLAGIVSIVMGGIFVFQGIEKDNLIAEAMSLEKVAYGSADGAISGVIDTPEEAQAMADILREHRLTNYGYYTELGRDDPKRDQILKAMTMENALNLAQLGYGLTEVVKATGVFMVIIGLTLGVSSAYAIRSSSK